MITVNVNNQSHSFAKEPSLSELLIHLDIVQKGIAVAVNNAIVTQTAWNEFMLKDGALVLIVKATQGG
ncbi:sulfur carrier protein ThiS [Leeuwenhoekiella sp. MAR_2009_132]|uniref:sulfur carrier protein ThiS n=1 Tax=Leeuwenhoekiella sp. MAR_2009_132 TaxID=1392489 RepID=UPI00048F628C|nr:sulfur carrier protein ThiS [Leeuwenhoekiella sp. MAR_2009_132]